MDRCCSCTLGLLNKLLRSIMGTGRTNLDGSMVF